jgi:hypothetical protein
MHPVDTVKGVPAGVGRFFRRVGLGAKKITEAATTPEEASAGEKARRVASARFIPPGTFLATNRNGEGSRKSCT